MIIRAGAYNEKLAESEACKEVTFVGDDEDFLAVQSKLLNSRKTRYRLESGLKDCARALKKGPISDHDLLKIR